MKRSFLHRAIPMFALLALLGLSVNSFATPPDTKGEAKATNSLQHKLGKVELHSDHSHVYSKPAIAFKPLDMVDPKTGKKVTADTMLDINGHRIRAGEHHAKILELEKKFNALGYTLNDKTGGKVVLAKTKINEQELDEHSKKHMTSHLAFHARMRAIPSHDDIAKKQTAMNDAARMQGMNAAAAAPAAGAAKTSSASKSWNYTMGSKNILAAYLSGKLEIKGSKDEVSVLGEARGGGYVMGRDVNIIKANGSATAPAKGKSKANLHVYLLGQHVVNLDKSGDASWQLQGTKQHGIDVHADFHFSIGPIPMVAHIGARGNAGVKYMVALRPAHATFQVTPFVDAKVYVKAGVDAFLVSGGGGGEVTLLKDELKIGAELDLTFDPNRGPILTEHFYVQNHMNMLSGKVYAWARVNYLFGSKEWHHDLWSWKGLQTNGYLINENRTQVLIPNFQPAAAAAAAAPMAAQGQSK